MSGNGAATPADYWLDETVRKIHAKDPGQGAAALLAVAFELRALRADLGELAGHVGRELYGAQILAALLAARMADGGPSPDLENKAARAGWDLARLVLGSLAPATADAAAATAAPPGPGALFAPDPAHDPPTPLRPRSGKA